MALIMKNFKVAVLDMATNQSICFYDGSFLKVVVFKPSKIPRKQFTDRLNMTSEGKIRMKQRTNVSNNKSRTDQVSKYTNWEMFAEPILLPYEAK